MLIMANCLQWRWRHHIHTNIGSFDQIHKSIDDKIQITIMPNDWKCNLWWRKKSFSDDSAIFFSSFSAILILRTQFNLAIYVPQQEQNRTRYVFISICFDSWTMINWQLLITLSDFYWNNLLNVWKDARICAFSTASTFDSRAIVILFSIGPWWIERCGWCERQCGW